MREAAPLETPSTDGSASGLRSRAGTGARDGEAGAHDDREENARQAIFQTIKP